MRGLYIYSTLCLIIVLLSNSSLYFKISIAVIYLYGIYKYFYLNEKK